MDCCKGPDNLPCCQVESVVSIDERGQMVLPKEIREKSNIKAGDKLALVRWNNTGNVGFIALVKIEDLNRMVQQMLGPALKEING
ncbi:MAG: HgcAB-associated protein [Dehalococcoidales bacterium]|jgi:AbrB family looped-hinge helix DNA binding protein|nr:HgcAB-associated protein [Dehalococcoidales bacterium]NLT27918.1 AbrB/MazE/SpoVT family DNA-binding domain-containing protein [Dehalococcoidales bacterium]